MPRKTQLSVRAFLTAAFALYLSTARADLSSTTPRQLLDAVVAHDALYPNQRATYTVEETFDQRIDPRSSPKRLGTYQFCRESGKYFYNVSLVESAHRPMTCRQSFDGHLWMQFFGGQNTGDLFKDNSEPAWPTPVAFGLTFGSRDVKLGAAIAAGKITNVTVGEWDGHSVYLVAWLARSQHVRAWIDPAADWRARRIESASETGPYSSEVSTEFQKLSNGVWYPVSGIETEYYQGPLTNNNRIVSHAQKLMVTHAEVGFAATDRDFRIEFPNGTAVYDHVAKFGYLVGPGSISNDNHGRLDELAGLSSNGFNHLEFGPNTASENTSIKEIASAGVCALLLIGVGLYIAAKVKRKSPIV